MKILAIIVGFPIACPAGAVAAVVFWEFTALMACFALGAWAVAKFAERREARG